MDNRQLANEIKGLDETIQSLILEIGYLRDDLEVSNKNNDNLKIRMSQLESALKRN